MSAKRIVAVFALMACSLANAQQDPQYTQYMYNTIQVNPAYAGSRGKTSIFGIYRAQWVGLEGAPTTAAASVNAPVGNKLGLGLSFVNDRIGPMDDNAISVDFSYTIDVSYNYQLAFGLKGTADLLNIDFTKLNIYNPDDPGFQNNVDNQFSPNFGAGVFLYSDNTYFGVSVPDFLETKHYEHNTTSVAKDRMHYYFIGGHVFDLTYNLKFKPAAMVKATKGSPLQADVSANFLYDEKLTLGMAYRWDAALSALVGFQVTKDVFVGYTYDMETTRLAEYNSGSHEIYLRFELVKKNEKVENPRFF
nr:type IX secretion system membrane protein PorP/SprF [Flavobacterium beibuense]